MYEAVSYSCIRSLKVRLVEHKERWVDLRRHVYDDSRLDDRSDLSPDLMVKWAKLHVRARVDHTSAHLDAAEVLYSAFTQFTCFTRSRVPILTPERCMPAPGHAAPAR